MQFLADVELICEECKGKRYKPEVLEVRYHGKNIHEVLDLTVKERAALLLRGAEDRREAARAGRSWPGLPAARAVGHDALRRRGAAHEAGGAPSTEAARLRHARRRSATGGIRECSTSSTNRPPGCTSTT